ncbi:hypothetical protein, partial [Paraburkholderia sp. RL17-373-BIF-A]|uniref:hypothetical protein n=1 Tax=Paraburkholderia sp. RL17-373-BIF-A TaxID=3031629 RepID=UPI0038BD7C3C
ARLNTGRVLELRHKSVQEFSRIPSGSVSDANQQRGLCYRPISVWREGEAGRYIYVPGVVPYVMSVLSPPRVEKAIRHTP